jgi:hypothetical protein
MDADILFLERCNQIQILAQSPREIDVLDIGGRLRQLFMDKIHLISTANKNKIKLRFVVGRFGPMPEQLREGLVWESLEDGVDPTTSPSKLEPLLLNLDDFLAHHVMTLHGKRILIKDIILFTSNVAGSIHHDPRPKKEFEALAEFSKYFLVGGMPAGVRTLKAIARVALRGLQPLIDDVKMRHRL